jgi:hypothetical protein
MCNRFRIVNSELANPTLGRPAGKIEPIDTGEPYIKTNIHVSLLILYSDYSEPRDQRKKANRRYYRCCMKNALSNLAYRHPKHTPAARPKNQPTSHGAGISRGAAGALLGIRRVTTVRPDPTTRIGGSQHVGNARLQSRILGLHTWNLG